MVQNLKLAHIHPSKTNPRQRYDENELAQLADNIKQHGVLQPVLVRERVNANGAKHEYELVAGERRYRAAKLAGKEDIPAIVRELTDVEVLEIQVIENSQRADLHPLEEAAGFKALILTKQYDVAKIAAKVSRPTRYVYDRLRLLDLTKEAKQLFLDGKFAVGHAVLLSRLTPEQQNAILDVSEVGMYRAGGLFEVERDLWSSGSTVDDENAEATRHLKPKSVAELSRYIDEHVRMEPHQPDLPELLPDTARAIENAVMDTQKVVLITRANWIPDDTRAGDKILFPRSWRRADGQAESNDPQSWEFKGYKPATCEHSVMGFVAVGPGRGEAFPVCTAKKKCKTHWKDAMKAAADRGAAKAPTTDGTPKDDPYAKQRARQAKEQAEREASLARIKAARTHIEAALVAAVKKEAIKPKSVIWRILEDQYYPHFDRVEKHLGKIITADLFMRGIALEQVLGEVEYGDNLAQDCNEFGIDLAALLDKHAPVEKAAPAKKKATKKKGGK